MFKQGMDLIDLQQLLEGRIFSFGVQMDHFETNDHFLIADHFGMDDCYERRDSGASQWIMFVVMQ